jgi:hypothetical protein
MEVVVPWFYRDLKVSVDVRESTGNECGIKTVNGGITKGNRVTLMIDKATTDRVGILCPCDRGGKDDY